MGNEISKEMLDFFLQLFLCIFSVKSFFFFLNFFFQSSCVILEKMHFDHVSIITWIQLAISLSNWVFPWDMALIDKYCYEMKEFESIHFRTIDYDSVTNL